MDFEVLGELIELAVDNPQPDCQTAREMAKARARDINPDAMMLSWYSGLTGDITPRSAVAAIRDRPGLSGRLPGAPT